MRSSRFSGAFRAAPLAAWLFAGLFSCLLAGCYSFSGSTLPSHLRTIRIYPVENRTLEAALPDRVARGLQDGFRSRSNLRQVNQNGDAELYGTVLQYSHTPQSTDGSDVTTWRVDILFRAVFVDRVRGDTLYNNSQVQGYGAYAPAKGETEETGQARAIENLVQTLVDNTVLAW
jgi:hypothetical protein